MVALVHHHQPPPTAQEVAIARQSGQRLSRYVGRTRPLTFQVEQEPVELPAGAVALLMEILEAMAAGRGVTIIPENAELTTVEAADMLNVSRTFLIEMLEKGEIPFRKVGTKRRIRTDDVMAYKENIDRKREGALDELVRESEKLGLYGRGRDRHKAVLDELREKKDIIHARAEEFGARRLRVFGSVARREERPDSDIDFVADFPKGYSMFRQRLPLAAKLEELTGRKVELVPEHEMNGRMRDSVLKEAVEL
jgi:excisionase family DNA binding protein